MRSAGSMAYSGVLPRLTAVAMLGVGLAACSSDTGRFHSDAYAARNAQPSGEVTGSVNRPYPAQQVETRPLAQPLPPPAPAAISSTGVIGGGNRGLGTYQPNSPDVTGSLAQPLPPPAPAPLAARPTYGDPDGGTTVTVAPGETIYSLSQRHGVTPAAILQANNISNANALQAGQRLVIPRHNATAVTGSIAQRPAMAPRSPAPPRLAAPVAPGAGQVHVVASGDTLHKIARRYRVSVANLAKANNKDMTQALRIGERLTVPGAAPGRIAQAPAIAPAFAPRPVQVAAPANIPVVAAPATVRPPQAPRPLASAESPHVARVATPTSNDEKELAPDPSAKTAEPTGALPSFRWPVRGRIIAGYGPKTNGQQNDGINLAVPEGTPIKAAEDGTVAYAGNELKGYGNLVLVRHANGFVTAYAHASELMVRRGDQVKRGQVIARSGQTGTVSSPQLHFEIRKGATPVDPTRYLNGA